MKKYIKKIEELVEKKLNEKETTDKNKTDSKGFLSKRNKETEENTQIKDMDLVEIVADNVAYIRRQRMELK